METEKSKLIENFALKDTDELIQIYLEGNLSSTGYDCISEVLQSRGIGSYELYLKANLTFYKRNKEHLQQEISNLMKNRDILAKQVEQKKNKLNPKNKNLVRLFIERKRLEEEEKINKLKVNQRGDGGN